MPIHAPSAAHPVRTRARAPQMPAASGGGPESAVVLEEMATPLGVVLWRTLRSVLVWADTPPAERAHLFADGAYENRMAALLEAAPAAEVAGACEALAEVLASPERVRADQVAGGCVAVAGWAREQGCPGTRLAFLSAAARCCPHDASLALMAGREARDQAQYPLAEGWLDRAVAVARHAGEWELYARAHIAQGTMMIARGGFPAARRHLHRAERRSARHGLREPRAMALHDLFVVSVECGEPAAARRWAAEALVTYPAGHPRLVNLAFDLAFSWMREGYFEAALPIFRGLLPRVEARFQAHIQGAIARAAGACGLGVEHEQAVGVLRGVAAGPGLAEAWMDAAHGAVSLGRWDEAGQHAEASRSLAHSRGERKVEILAESLLDSIRQRAAAAGRAAVEAEPEVRKLALDVAASLSRVPAGSAA